MKTTVSKTHLAAAGIIAVAFIAGFASGPAFADQSKGDDFKFDFAYEKSELATSESAAKLLTRLESKVKRYCAGMAPTGSRLRKNDSACFKTTMDQTVASFGSAMVADLYKSRAAG